MILNTFTRLASLALYLLSSGFLAANDEPFLMSFETANKQIKTASKASPSSQDDPLLSAFEKQRDEALTKAQEGKATLAQQARQIEAMKKLLAEKNAAETEAQEVEARLAQQAQEMADLMALLNPSPKPKPSVVPALSTPVKPSASVASSSATASASIPRSLDIAIPEVARGYEEVYRRFLGGKLIYTDPSSKAKTELPIRALSNPLEGTFDLSGCGDTGQYLCISVTWLPEGSKTRKRQQGRDMQPWKRRST